MRQFLAFDEGGTCNISISSLRNLLQDPKSKQLQDDISLLFSKLDLREKDVIACECTHNVCELLISLLNHREKKLSESVYKAVIRRSPILKAFREFDRNGDGWITEKEFRAVMRSLQGTVGDAHLKSMIKTVHKNDNGRIDYEEFVLMTVNKLLMYNVYGVF